MCSISTGWVGNYERTAARSHRKITYLDAATYCIGAEHFSIDDLLVLDLPEGEGHGEEALPQVGDREIHNENVPEEKF
jgi:hypothetical protein